MVGGQEGLAFAAIDKNHSHLVLLGWDELNVSGKRGPWIAQETWASPRGAGKICSRTTLGVIDSHLT